MVAFAGLSAGIISRCCVAPLDLLKIRYQVGARDEAPYRSLLHACRTIAKREGPRAFWKGNLAGLIMAGPYTSIAMLVYHRAHSCLSDLAYFDDGEQHGRINANNIQQITERNNCVYGRFILALLRTVSNRQ